MSTPPAAAAQNLFDEYHPPLQPGEAVVEATRCLYCYDAPCTRACPTHIDIPRFIRQIMHNDPIGSAKTILDSNIFGGSCARACPTEVLCEGACVDNTMLKTPVQIGRLQRFACDTADDISLHFYEAGPDTGKRVAIIGAGPAGLTCAHELRKRGHAVTVFDAGPLPGGLNTVGIAPYKITTEFALTEVKRIQQLGIDMRLKSPVNGAGLTKLLTDYDAVFLAIGLGRTAPIQIPGEDLPNVWESLEFIFQMHTNLTDGLDIGKTVVVIGGGNTAIDAARAAVRLGAESVTIAYRRDPASLPAFTHERDAALAEGIRIEYLAIPKAVVAENNCVRGVLFARAQMQGEGRQAKLTAIKDSEFILPVDTVIKALGQQPLADFVRAIPALKLSAKTRVLIDPATGATSVPKLFAGGDCVEGSNEEIVNAVQAGKVAAAGIHEAIFHTAVL